MVKRTLEAFKQNPIEAIALTVCMLFLCISGTYIVPVLVNAVVKSNPIGLAEWIIGIAIPAISAFGAVFCIIRINKITFKGKLILNLLITAVILFLFEVIFIFLAKVITESVCNMISGSILTAKIALGICLPLLKLPVYALLICMISSVSNGGNLFSKIKVKGFLSLLLMLFTIHVIALVCSMTGATMASGILQCVLLSMLAVSAIFISKKIEGEFSHEKALV